MLEERVKKGGGVQMIVGPPVSILPIPILESHEKEYCIICCGERRYHNEKSLAKTCAGKAALASECKDI